MRNYHFESNNDHAIKTSTCGKIQGFENGIWQARSEAGLLRWGDDVLLLQLELWVGADRGRGPRACAAPVLPDGAPGRWCRIRRPHSWIGGPDVLDAWTALLSLATLRLHWTRLHLGHGRFDGCTSFLGRHIVLLCKFQTRTTDYEFGYDLIRMIWFVFWPGWLCTYICDHELGYDLICVLLTIYCMCFV